MCKYWPDYVYIETKEFCLLLYLFIFFTDKRSVQEKYNLERYYKHKKDIVVYD